MRRLKLSFDGQLLAYTKTLDNGILVYELYEDVDGILLKDAVNKAMDYHPVFKSKIVKSFGTYYIEENTKEAVVIELPWEKSIVYGTKEFNEFPWLCAYTENKITFVAAHFLTDGAGEISFMKTVLRFYFEGKGAKFPSDFGLVSDIKATYVDAFKKTGINKAKKAITTLKTVSATKVPDEFYDFSKTDFENIVYYFIINKEDIHKLGTESETSSASVLAALGCRAYAKAASLKSGFVTASIACDL